MADATLISAPVKVSKAPPLGVKSYTHGAARGARGGPNGVLVPSHASTFASTASAWGSQKVISMARYNAKSLQLVSSRSDGSTERSMST